MQLCVHIVRSLGMGLPTLALVHDEPLRIDWASVVTRIAMESVRTAMITVMRVMIIK